MCGRPRVPGASAPPRTAAAGLRRSGLQGTAGPVPRRVLEARPEAERELLLSAVAVGPHCLQELSGIRRGRTGSLFHWDSPRVPAAAAAVAVSPFVLLGPPSLPFSLPLSVSGSCCPGRRRPSSSLSPTQGASLVTLNHFSVPIESSRGGGEQEAAAGPWPQDGDGSVFGPQSRELARPRAVAAGAQRSWGAGERPGAALLQRSL